MARIITITLNPTIDKSTTIKNLAPEKKLRCSLPKFEPGGGGLNVARAMKKLGEKAVAVYPAGQHTGKFLQQLMKNEEVDSKVVEIQNYTRENLIVMDTSNNQQYRFGMPGPEVSEEELKQILQLVEEEPELEIIVASGSLPPGMSPDVLQKIAAIAHKRNAKFIVDTSGEALQKAVDEGVYLLKPNLGELSSLVGKEEVSADEVDEVAMEIISRGKCEILVASLGPLGAMLVTKNEAIHVTPPVVKRKSTVGAGDCMVAGLVISISKGFSMKETLQYAVACGTAATMNSGTELCKPEDVERILNYLKKKNN